MDDVQRIILIGFSGTGKTTVARLLADKLGWDRYDTDESLEGRAGTSIPTLFAERSEAAFRELERQELHRALEQQRVVVATGGGAIVDPVVWEADLLGRPGTLVVALDAEPSVMLERLRRQHEAEGAAVERPMLAGDDPQTRIESLKERRQAAYDRAAITLSVDAVTPAHVASEIASLLPDKSQPPKPAVELRASSGDSDIYIQPGISAHAGSLARAKWPKARRAWIVTDGNVAKIHGDAAVATFQSAGFESQIYAVEPGEASKSLATTGLLYDWMLGGAIERGDIVVAFGGGVVGDLGGYVAATVLRGVGFVQMPTSLLAMVDASVGGKTGINHRTGKNLIGAFYQPPLVVIDPLYLKTMPPRSLTEGWAEVIKHAVIQRSTPGGERGDFLRFLQRNVGGLTDLSEPATSYLIARNVALKAAVVAEDEREGGLRAILNFGHTLGHAIEAADYRYLHGEAVAIGMRAAMYLGQSLGVSSSSDSARLDELIQAYGLPMVADVDDQAVMQLLGSDKKRISGTQRWILPKAGGGVVIQDGIVEEVVRNALNAVRQLRSANNADTAAND